MTKTKQIKNLIEEFEYGQLFTYKNLFIPSTELATVSKILSRLVNSTYIERFEKGVFYKPKKTKFGQLKPSESQIIKMIVKDKLNSAGYLTGLSIYNKLGLTTQVTNQVTIATPVQRKPLEVSSISIVYRKGIAPASEIDIELLQLLDAIKDFKSLPDRNDALFISIVSNTILKYERETLERFIKLSQEYPPRTRALLGAILELINLKDMTATLKASLNSLTTYKLGINEAILPNKNNWKII